MKFLKWLFILVVIAWAVLYFIPADYEVSRSTTINAPAEQVFDQINSFPKWAEWSAWANIDPNMVNNYSGPASGVGHINEWTSDHQDVGNGKQEIVEVVQNRMVKTDLDFGLFGQSSANFVLEGVGNETTVTWDMKPQYGLNPIPKIFALVMDMDEMVGPSYEESLASLKGLVEKNYMQSRAGSMGKIQPRGLEVEQK